MNYLEKKSKREIENNDLRIKDMKKNLKRLNKEFNKSCNNINFDNIRLIDNEIIRLLLNIRKYDEFEN